MGSAATVANVPEILKNVWKDDIFDFMYEDQPLLGLLDKDTSWDGLYQIITVMYGGMSGRSNTFDDAQLGKGPPKYKQMQISTRDNFALWSVDHKLVTLSRNNRGALVRALAESTEKATTKLKRSSCWQFWRNGGGAVGTVQSVGASSVVLEDINDVRNFDLDDPVNFATDDGSASSPAGIRSGSAIITAIDEDTGTLTFNVTMASIGVTAADSIFHRGDYAKSFLGIPAYCTLFTPGTGGVPTSLWGMDRSDFPTRLAGSRFTGTVATVTQDIKDALATGYRRNIETTHLFVPPEIYSEIETDIGTARRYTTEKVGTVGYEALVFTTQGGKSVKVYSDADIPKSPDGSTQYVFGLNLDTWKFHTADEYPMWLASVANGGGKFHVEHNANATEGRLGGYGQLYTHAPGQNWNLALT